MRGFATSFVLLLGLAPQAFAAARDYLSEELFRSFPFDRWAAKGAHADIHWSAHVNGPILSNHQRFVAAFEALIDGREMFKRSGHGQLVVMVRIKDASGKASKGGTVLDLSDIPEQARLQDWSVVQQAFLLPGDYDAEIAVSDTKTKEYSFARRKLHVAPLHGDPLPNAWRNLPAVEMIPAQDLPDAWYLPDILNGISIAPGNERPVHVDVLMNITPSERASGSIRVFRRNMGLIIPALKSLTAMAPVDGGFDLAVADLVQHSIVGEQKNIRELDWSLLRKAFAETTPGVVDARALAQERTMKQYFRDQVQRRADSRQGPRVLLVLSAPVVFDKQDDVLPLNLPVDPNRRVIYVRFRPYLPPVVRRGAGGRGAPLPVTAPPQVAMDDDLEGILRPLTPRVLNVTQPLDFRKALAHVLEEITRLGQPAIPPVRSQPQ
jgi:hypothetical protein